MNSQENNAQSSILSSLTDKNEDSSIWADFPRANPNIVFSIDFNNHIDFFNPVAQQWLEKHHFKETRDLLKLLPEKVIETLILNNQSPTKKIVGESLLDGCFFQYSISKFPQNDLFFVELIDISEQKRIERLREDTERIVKHDLRSPLNVIIGYAQLLLMSCKDENTKESLALIYSAGTEINDMIDTSLDLFKMEEGTYSLESNEFDLLKVINNIKRNIAPVYKNNISCSIRGDKPTDEYLIFAEQKHIKTVLNNIITNALEATPVGETIDIDISRNENFHIIKVQNKGTIANSIIDVFFDKYTTAGKQRGMGLGTYSAKLIVETHQGELDVNCCDGFVTLTIKLPF